MEMSVMRLVFKLSIFTCTVFNLKICLTYQIRWVTGVHTCLAAINLIETM